MPGPRVDAIADTSGQDVRIAPRSRTPLVALALACTTGAIVGLYLAVPFVLAFFAADGFLDRGEARIAAVRSGTFERSVSVEGRVVSDFSPRLFSALDGNVFLAVREGDAVDEGALLARIDNQELESQLRQEEAAMALLEVELDAHRNRLQREALERTQALALLELNLAAEQRELKRRAQIRDSGGVSEIEYERAIDRVEALDVQVANARQQNVLVVENHTLELRSRQLAVDQKRLAVNDLSRRFSERIVSSPVTGVVGEILVDERDRVSRNQPLMSVVDLSAYRLEVSVPETYADSLTAGLPVEVSYRGSTFSARLDSIAPAVRDGNVGGRVAFPDEAPDGLRENLTLTCKVILERINEAVMVRRGPFVEAHGGRGVFVVTGDGATFRRIEIGSVGVTDVHVTAGLEVGESVIISDTAPLAGFEQIMLTN